MKKHNYKLIAGLSMLLALGSVLLVNCKKLTDGVVITINANAVKYPTAIQIYDPANPATAPENLTITVSGPSAASVYEVSGVKNLDVKAGKITLGIYGATPADGAPLTYTVTAKAPGYLDVVIPVTITAQQSPVVAQTKVVSMLNIANPPDGVKVAQEDVPTDPTTGATTAPQEVATDTTSKTPVKISIPTGTTFTDADGNVLKGAAVTVTALSFDPSEPGAANSFPGGNSAKQVEGQPNGALLTPVAFTTINMNVGGTTVKKFNQAIPVSMTLSPTQINPKTGNVVQVGETFPIYSYDELTGAWSYEQDVNITTDPGNGKMVLAFATTHLCTFAGLDVTPGCGITTITLSDGTAAATTYMVDVYRAGKTAADEKPLFSNVATNNAALTFDGVQASVDIYVFTNSVDNSPSNYKVRGTVVKSLLAQDACAKTITVSFAPPATDPAVTFNLRGKCDDGNGNITYVTPDNVSVYYRAGGSSDMYQFLGTIVQGKFSTTNLKVGQTYEFEVPYRNDVYHKTKTVDQQSYYGDTNGAPTDVDIPLQYQDNLCKTSDK